MADIEWIAADNLAVERGGRQILSGLSFRLHSGDVLYLQGANGSGKTSLLRVLAGLSPLGYSGDLSLAALTHAPDQLAGASRVMFLGHNNAVKPSLSPRENLVWLQQLAGLNAPEPAVTEALEKIGLGDVTERQCRYLSAGQNRRVALARLFLDAAPLWILDEPYTALDATGIEAIEARIDDHADAGGSVILTSHQLPGLKSRVKTIALDAYRK